MAKKAVAKKTAQAPPVTAQHAIQPQDADSDLFPIVGFGASAGGVEAVTQVLGSLPSDTGMGFVLVQHLDAKHESILKDIVSRSTQMPVTWAAQDVKVERNHIYILPPNAGIAIANGILKIRARENTGRLHLPIDSFFRSLAEDRHSMAIGVILSGTASDGTLGIKAIKAEGGITFAQSELSAKYNGMPSSAVSAGFVDYVLPPDGIARELARIGGHPYLRLQEQVPVPQAESANELAKLFYMLRNATGVDFTHYKHSTIRRRIARRMAVQKIERLPDYVVFLRKNPSEIQILYQDILINLTSFFRDPEMYDGLNRVIFPKLLRKRPVSDPIRIWVPGCSSGEEAYSIAIALTEHLRAAGESLPIQIFGTEISDTALEKARAGVYPESAVAEIPQDLLRRYFTPAHDGYQVTNGLRELCVFARQNVVRDAPFSKLDLISCRNLLIYLAPVLQRRLMNVFHYALKPNGFLVLGNSETIGSLSELFTLVDKKNKFYTRHPGPARPPVEFSPASASFSTEFSTSFAASAAAEPVRPVAAEPVETVRLGREVDRLLLNRFAPAGVVIDDTMRVMQFRGRTGRFLEPEPGDANLNLLRMAREGLLPDLRAAIYEARRKKAPARIENVRVLADAGYVDTAIEVIPLPKISSQQEHFLVLFPEKQAAVRAPKGVPESKKERGRELLRLRAELASAKQYLQSIIEEQEANNEELKSANEEIQSANEELQSTNEEMETAKEELQSTNEELTTVNEEMKTRNAELGHLNNDLENLLVSIQIPLVIVDSELRLRRFTQPAQKLLNLIPTDVGRPLLDIKPNLYVPNLAAVIREVLDSLKAFEGEISDHQGRSYSMSVRPYRTAENRIDGAVLAFSDNTALKRILEQSRALREYSEALAATVHEPFLVLDSELRVLAANPPFYENFGLKPETTERQPLFELGGGEWNIPELRDLLTKPPGPEGFLPGIELEHVFPAGRKRLSINVRRLSADGSTRAILLAIEDVSARRRAEAALRLTQARYSVLTRDAPVGILQLDLAGNCTFANVEAAHIVGVRAERAHGRGWMKHIHPDDLRMLKDKLSEAEKSADGFSTDLRFLYSGGSASWSQMILIPIAEKDHPKRYLAALTDVSARKDLEERLAQANKMEAMGRLAGGIAHDFNNMLTAISTYATQLLALVPENHPARRAAVQIDKMSENAATITRQLLAFSRKQVLRPERVAINEAIRDMHDLLARLLGDGIEIKLELDPDAGAAMVDVGQIQQVLLNLAINARDAMEGHGQLLLATGKTAFDAAAAERDGLTPGEYIVLTVSDTGAGLDAATRERMFEPFFTTKPPGEGTGLGLAMVYGIVTQSGGNIHVESTPKRGTAFRIFLPRDSAPAEPLQPELAAGLPKESGIILLVEDAAVVRSLVRELLEERGYTVLEAHDAHEALNMSESRKEPIDLLLTDVVMPGMSGAELAKKLRRRRKNLRVIYMSGYSGDSLREIEGKENFLEKPFKPDELAELVRKTLDPGQPSNAGKAKQSTGAAKIGEQ